MLKTRPYHLPSQVEAKLDALVARIEERPGDLIDVREFEELQQRMDVRDVLRTLPEGLSEDDFAGILKLALLTECATETYGDEFAMRARHFDARWLGRFNTNVWVPDELTHHAPYKYILMSLGFDEAQLDREIRQTQEKEFKHKGGDTPVHVTTFGIVQEYLTDNWHGLIATMLREAAPEAAYMATRIKRRETLHTVWYRDMTALQIEARPRYMTYVAEALLKFTMPGNTLVPELQAQVGRWMPLMGADFERITKDLVRLVHETMGNTRATGRLLVEIAAERGFNLGPVSPKVIRAAADRLGGPGYGLLGEALLQRVGLAYTFRRERERQDSAFRLYDGAYERIRSLLRGWVAKQIDFRLGDV
ncbi:MAG: acyl-ACP desaturase [Dehalococcoidia bacterium]